MGNGIRYYWSAWCMLLCTRLCRSGTDPCCDKTWKKSCIYERMHSTKMGITGDALQDLAACSLLHDNALTQYIHEEFHNDLTKNNTENITSKQLGIHCIYGEENLKMYPFLTDVKNVILYHHENADGSGPFGKTWEEIPLFARIIHLCDILDAFCRTPVFDDAVWQRAKDYL